MSPLGDGGFPSSYTCPTDGLFPAGWVLPVVPQTPLNPPQSPQTKPAVRQSELHVASTRISGAGDVPALNPSATRFDHKVFRKVLTASTSTDNWSRWFKDLQVSPNTSEIVVEAPSGFVANQVKARFLREVEEAARSAGAGTSPLGVRVTVNETDAVRSSNGHAAGAPVPSVEKTTESPAKRHPSNFHRFATFEVGPSNRFAHAAAWTVAEDPGIYNPLFVYGASGVGKSHLLYAIANHARRRHPSLVIRYCTAEAFVQSFIQSVGRRRMEDFRRRFRQVDMLLLDDFQFLEGKEQTLEEFFWTFNSLHQDGKQIVISCDRPPRDLTAMEDRIRSRVTGGLLADVAPPCLETRLTILRRLNAGHSPPFSPDVLSMVAERITDNVRDLQSALRRLSAYSTLVNQPLTPQAASELLAPLSGFSHSAPTPEKIIAACAEAFDTSVAEILGRNRRPIPSAARRVAMYLTRELTDLSYPRIGKAFGRDHSTVISAHRGTLAQISTNQPFAERVSAIHSSLHTH